MAMDHVKTVVPIIKVISDGSGPGIKPKTGFWKITSTCMRGEFMGFLN